MASTAGVEETQPDEELAALMTSALEDFSKINSIRPTKEDDVTTASVEKHELSNQRHHSVDEEWMLDNGPSATEAGAGKTAKSPGKAPAKKKKNTQSTSPADTANVDRMWKELIDADPALKDHWEKLAESCTKAGKLLSGDTPPSFFSSTKSHGHT